MWRKYFLGRMPASAGSISTRTAALDGPRPWCGSAPGTISFLRSVVEARRARSRSRRWQPPDAAYGEPEDPVPFPERGLRMIEDLHCAYMGQYGGRVRRKANFFNHVRDIIDDMHRWYHPMPPRIELDRIVSGSMCMTRSSCSRRTGPICRVHSKVGKVRSRACDRARDRASDRARRDDFGPRGGAPGSSG